MTRRGANAVIRGSAWLAPARLRDRWREEWLAEVATAPQERLTWVRLAGAPWDAVSARWTTRTKPWPTRPSETRGLFRWVIRLEDIRYALRRLRRQPAATAISIATLACSIGAAAATWSLLSEVLLDPLHLPHPEQLVAIGIRNVGRPVIFSGMTYPDFVALRDANPMGLTASGSIGGGLPVQTTSDPVTQDVRFAQYDFLSVLGVQTSVGRFFTREEDRPGGPLVAVLTDRFWHLEFQSDPTVIGRLIHVAGQPVTVVGIVSRRFRGLALDTSPALYMPLHAIDRLEPQFPGLYGDRPVVSWVQVVGRLPPGVTLDQMAARIGGPRPDSRGTEVTLVPTPVRTAAVPQRARAGVRQFSVLLGATVALLLGIGILTVGMLLVLRTEARAGEFAACQALGASRARLAAGVALEGLFLAGGGALLALPISEGFFAGARLFQLPGGIRLDRLDLSLNGQVLTAVIATAVASVLLITLLLTIFGVRRDPVDVLRSHAGATPRLTRRTSRSALVTAQVAVALILVSGAGLFGRSILRALSLNPGVDISRLVRISVDPTEGVNDPARSVAFFGALHSRLAHDPNLAGLGTSRTASRIKGGIQIDGQTQEGLPEVLIATYIDANYFHTIGLPVLAGRAFNADDRAAGPPVAIVNATLARLISGSASPIGHRLSATENDVYTTAAIVGVVPDFSWGVSDQPAPALYEPMSQEPPSPFYPGASPGQRNVLIRAMKDAPTAIAALGATIHSLDATVHLKPMTTVEADVLNDVAPQRFGMTVMGALGTLALLLSVLGTYVLAESMSVLRRREMGIRAALGASQGRLQMLLLSETVRLVGIGLIVGFGLGWLGTDTIRGFLFEVQPFDPLVTGSVAMLIIGVAILVSLRPALAAARLDLARVLHDD